MNIETLDPLSPGPHERLRDSVRKELIERIVTGKLSGGQKINEARVAKELMVSRTPLREALLHLEQEALVRSDLRRGFTVEPLSAREVRETYPILALLECLALLSSANFVRLLVPDLERINSEFADAASSEQALDLDTLWHDTLIGKCANRKLLKMIAELRIAIRRYEHAYMSDPGLISTSVAQHSAIIGRIREGDIEAAAKGVEGNYRFGMEVLLGKMGEA